MKKNSPAMNRRSFIQKSSIAGLALGLTKPRQLLEEFSLADFLQEKKKTKQLEYRVLGRTGLKVTTVAFGAMRTTDAAVLQRALDLGINYIDTAHSYQDGNNEVMVGNVMKNRRQDAYIATKVRSTSADEMRAMVETSLRRLQTDVIDVLQLHGLQTKEEVNNETAMEVLTRLKQEGKIRFMGFSTHRNQAEVIRAAVANRFYDVILVAYNFNSDNSVKEAIAEAAKVGIGIVAMKTQAGGYKTTKMGSLSPHQAALKWVLQDRNVATTIPSMVTFAQLEENIQVMGSKMGWQDWKTLDRYARSIDKLYCRICDSCAGTCPHGVAISDVNRCLMYAEGYGDLILAQQSYRDIPLSVNASQCRTCRTCMAKCVHGINIGQKMKLANQLFC